MSKKDHDYFIKIMIIGDSNVGKSSIINTFSGIPFDESFNTTIGVDFRHRTILIDDKKVKIQIWDTAGQERFHSICSSYYRGAMGIIMVYDITDSKSFGNLSKWLRNVDENGQENVLKMILGNKCDKEEIRVVPTCHGEEMAEKFDIPFYETSAKDNINIDSAIISMTKRIIDEKFPVQNQASLNETASNNTVNFTKILKTQGTGCCS